MKPLEQWYREINSTFLDRNFYRTTDSIFVHLVEVSRGLCVATGKRRKRDLKPAEFLPKSLAWWLTLCGRAGVPNIEDMLWGKFPGVCPYCQRQPHDGRYCKENDPTKKEVKWDELKEIGSKHERPENLAEWQRHFNNIFPRTDSTDHETNVNRLSEELGELAEAIRVLSVAPQYFISEAPDVFAWLMGFANQFDFDNSVQPGDYGLALEAAMEKSYPGYCSLCERYVCKCPPVPPETLGRIAKEAPLKTVLKRGQMFSTQESVALFRQVSQDVTIGSQRISATTDELKKIGKDVDSILRTLARQSDVQPRIAVELAAALGALHHLTSQGEVTQKAINEVLNVVQNLPSEGRAHLLGFLNNIAASATFSAILATAQAIGA